MIPDALVVWVLIHLRSGPASQVIATFDGAAGTTFEWAAENDPVGVPSLLPPPHIPILT